MATYIKERLSNLGDLSSSKESKIVEFFKSKDSSNDHDLLAQTPENRSIVDLDHVVEKWIAYMWGVTTNRKSDKVDFDDLEIEIDWKRVDIYQAEANFENRNLRGDLKTQTLFKTYFTNKTNVEQEYSFQTERTTRQTCSFTFIKGFSREKEAAMSFKIPGDICEIGGGVRCEQAVEMGKDETKEEEVKWGVNSIIKVQPHTKTSAELIINELELERNFKANMILKGRLVAHLHNKKDKGFVKAFSGDIIQILKTAVEKHWLPSDSTSRIHFDQKKATIEFHGKCKFRLGVEQHVNIHEEELC